MATKTYRPLATTTISGGSTASYTFSSIPQGYTDLRVIFDGGASGNINMWLQFNGDTGTNYSYTYWTTDGGSVTSSKSSSNSKIQVNYYGYMQADLNANMLIDVFNYSNTTTYKPTLSRANHASNGTAAVVGLWRGSTGSATQAITSLTLTAASGKFASGSTMTLYGIL